MTSSKGDDMQVNDIVIFSPRQGETAEGIVTRIWDKPKSDPYVTMQTTEDDRPRTFVRCSSEVRKALPCATQALHEAGKCECAGIVWTDTQAAERAQMDRARVWLTEDELEAQVDHDSIVIREGRCAEHGGMDFAACPPAGA